MKRLRRWLFNFAVAVSLVVFLLTVVMWIRSFFVADNWGRANFSNAQKRLANGKRPRRGAIRAATSTIAGGECRECQQRTANPRFFQGRTRTSCGGTWNLCTHQLARRTVLGDRHRYRSCCQLRDRNGHRVSGAGDDQLMVSVPLWLRPSRHAGAMPGVWNGVGEGCHLKPAAATGVGRDRDSAPSREAAAACGRSADCDQRGESASLDAPTPESAWSTFRSIAAHVPDPRVFAELRWSMDCRTSNPSRSGGLH
jgi:hypothetical protein